MVNEKLVNSFAHCETYQHGSEGYRVFDEMTDFQLSELTLELEKVGFRLTYNLTDDCYCVE